MTRFWPKNLRRILLAASLGALAFSASAFPTKPIRILVTSGAGANLDVLTRALGEQMSKTLGQPIVVENVTGAGGLVALRRIAKQTPADGYTLVAASNTVVLLPAFNKEPGYDPVKDLTAIGDMQTVPYILVGPADKPEKTLAELLAAAKAKPSALALANGGIGTSTHLPALMLAQQAGVTFTHVGYKGNAAAIPDVVGSRVNGLFDAGVTAIPLIKDGKLRAYGVTTAKRVSHFPQIPTLAEQGLPGYDFKAFMGLFGPAGMPKDVVARLHEALRTASRTDALREMFNRSGSEAGTQTPEEFAGFIQRDAASAAKIVADFGIAKE